MRRTVVSASQGLFLGLLLVFSQHQSAFAGGRALACYEQAVVPAVYQTVQEQVLVRPATKRVVRQPAVYAYQTRQVVLQPERISYRTVAPIYSLQSRRVLVRPAGVGWEYRTRKGRRILCEIAYPAAYSTVRERVLVKPGGRVAVRQPAIYGSVRERVLVQPASQRVVREPAVYSTVTRTVKVRDAQTVWKPIRVRSGCRY